MPRRALFSFSGSLVAVAALFYFLSTSNSFEPDVEAGVYWRSIVAGLLLALAFLYVKIRGFTEAISENKIRLKQRNWTDRVISYEMTVLVLLLIPRGWMYCDKSTLRDGTCILDTTMTAQTLLVAFACGLVGWGLLWEIRNKKHLFISYD